MANVWIFQSNPNYYDLHTELDDPNCKEAAWSVRQHKDKIKKGDIALQWISGDNRGIYAIVDIISDPQLTFLDPESYEVYVKEGTQELMVKYRYRSKFKQPFLESDIKKIPGLSKLSIIRSHSGTNFPVTNTEWELLSREIKKRGLTRSKLFPPDITPDDDNEDKGKADSVKKRSTDGKFVVKFGSKIQPMPEGKEKLVTQTRLERNPKLREMAIEFHGPKCVVCGFTFTEKYGKLGKGYIEIHHLKPVSRYKGKGEVIVDPKTDLKPLCSNCHRMIHKPSKMLSIRQLKNIIKS